MLSDKPKPTLRFNLTVSGSDGFKLATNAQGDREIKMVEELTKLLIDKIEKIKINVGVDSDTF